MIKKLTNYKLVNKYEYVYGDCLQACINSIALNCSNKFRYLPFLDLSDIIIEPNSIGLNSSITKKSKLHGLSKYYTDLTGISIKKACKSNIAEIKNKYLKQNIPLIICMDSYYIKYHTAFKKCHMDHYMILLDYNNVNQTYIMQDPFFGKEKIEINHDMIKYIDDKIIMADFHFHITCKVKTIIETSLLDYYKSDAVVQMKQLCNTMMNVSWLENSTKGYDYLDLMPIFIQLKSIIVNRQNLIKAINSTLKKNEQNKVLIKKSEKCVEFWKNTFLSLYITITQNYCKDKLLSAISFFYQVLDREMETVEILINALKNIKHT